MGDKKQRTSKPADAQPDTTELFPGVFRFNKSTSRYNPKSPCYNPRRKSNFLEPLRYLFKTKP